MDKLEVVGWTAKKNLAWLRGAAFREATMFSWEPAGQYIALTPHAPAQAEIDRLRGEVERLNACAQEEADTLASRATNAEAISCSWKARALAAEAEVARLTAEREKDRKALQRINNTGAEQDGALGRILRMQRIALARLEDTDD